MQMKTQQNLPEYFSKFMSEEDIAKLNSTVALFKSIMH